jgi:peroxiredoxin
MEQDVDKLADHLPPTPLTLDGSYLLHQMFRVRWAAWRALGTAEQDAVLNQATAKFRGMEDNKQEATGLFATLGHKGDLMLVHFRKALDALNLAELELAQLKLLDFLEPMTSYLSVVELGLYEASVKLYADLTARGLQPGTAAWNREVESELAQQRQAAAPRLWPEIPQRRYLCFYPMNKFRGGRHYAGRVNQIISGSIGFDDWEWGVDLFADDPLVFKKLVYEMRFDEASAIYGLFGTFYVGLRFPADQLNNFLHGKAPTFR